MLQKNLLCFLSFCYLGLHFTFGANILYLCALPSPSHHVWYFRLNINHFQHNAEFTHFIQFQIVFFFVYRNSALINGLAAHGHNVTVISPDRDEHPPKGVHYIYLEDIYKDVRESAKTLFKVSSTMNPLTEPIHFNNVWYMVCKGKESLLKFLNFSNPN